MNFLLFTLNQEILTGKNSKDIDNSINQEVSKRYKLESIIDQRKEEMDQKSSSSEIKDLRSFPDN